MNFEVAIKRINKGFSNTFFARYMNDQWGVTVGFRTVDPNIAVMREELADWQSTYDCNNTKCVASRNQPVRLLTVGTRGTAKDCILNTPLSAYTDCWRHNWPGNVNDVLINSFAW
jgi:hypothetical protein